MPIYAGNSKIKEIYAGNSKIKEVWAGNSIVWKKGVTFEGIPPERLVYACAVASASSRASYIYNTNYIPTTGGTPISNIYADDGLDLSYINVSSATSTVHTIKNVTNRKLLIVCYPSSSSKILINKGNVSAGLTLLNITNQQVPIQIQTGTSSKATAVAIYDITDIPNVEPNVCIAAPHTSDIINNTLCEVWLDDSTPSGYGYDAPNFRSKATLWLSGDNTATVTATMDYADGTMVNLPKNDVIWENETLLPTKTSPENVSLIMVSFNITTPYA